jgi:hypothetical protein
VLDHGGSIVEHAEEIIIKGARTNWERNTLLTDGRR